MRKRYRLENQSIEDMRANLFQAIESLSPWKKTINENAAKRVENEISRLETDLDRHQKRMDGPRGAISMLVGTKYYRKLSSEWEKMLTTRNHLYEEQYDLCNWHGPYIEVNPKGYSCLGWCSSDPQEFVIWRRHLSNSERTVRPLRQSFPKEWAKNAWERKNLCIDCIIRHNLYCVVCGEVIDDSESRVEYEGYCICDKCKNEKQGEFALASEYVGKCNSCGEEHVPLKLVGDKLLCDHCSDEISKY